MRSLDQDRSGALPPVPAGDLVSEHGPVWKALLAGLESLPDLREASRQLRSLATSGECVELLLERSAGSQAALSELPELRGALESLADEQETVLELLELVELADAVEELAYLIGHVQGYRDELAWRIVDAEERVLEGNVG